MADRPLALVMDGSTVGRGCLVLLEQAQDIIPAWAPVMFLGDGESDGIGLQDAIDAYDWRYVCHTAKNRSLYQSGHDWAFETVPLEPGERFSLPQVTLRNQGYGPVHAIAWWEEGYDEPIHLLTMLASVDEVCEWYRKRARIPVSFTE